MTRGECPRDACARVELILECRLIFFLIYVAVIILKAVLGVFLGKKMCEQASN